MAICGKCKEEGVTIAHVRECYGVSSPAFVNTGFGGSLGEVLDGVTSHHFNPEAAFEDDDFPGEEEKKVKTRRKFVPPGDRIYMYVPRTEKDEAKSLLNARWDPNLFQWYIDSEFTDPELIPEKWAKPKQDLPDAIYLKEVDEEPAYFMVYHTVHGANQQVAKQLVFEKGSRENLNIEERVGEWVYKGKGPLEMLTEEDRLSEKDAALFGQVYGWCGVCGRALTNEDSKERGIGPKCAGL